MCVCTARSSIAKPRCRSVRQNGVPQSVSASPPPDVVDEHVESAVFPAHALEQPRDGRFVGVVTAHGDAGTAGGGDLFGGLLAGLGAATDATERGFVPAPASGGLDPAKLPPMPAQQILG
jgi:hypothetical protein